jgi:glycosyltransferase involved in cell wall biosynthesis
VGTPLDGLASLLRCAAVVTLPSTLASSSAPLGQPPLPHDTWVVIAAFNEHRRIGNVLDELLRLADNVVVVDDGSADETAAAVLTRPVWLVTHPVNLGQGAALQTGIEFALARRAQYIVTFDADGQHRPEDLEALVAALQTRRADFALGSRFLGSAEGIPASRRVLLKLAVLFTRVLSGVTLTDTHNGLRAMTRYGAEHINIRFNRMEHASEIIDQIAASGLRYVEVPVMVRYTADSLSKGQRTSAALGLGVRLLLDKVTR